MILKNALLCIIVHSLSLLHCTVLGLDLHVADNFSNFALYSPNILFFTSPWTIILLRLFQIFLNNWYIIVLSHFKDPFKVFRYNCIVFYDFDSFYLSA